MSGWLSWVSLRANKCLSLRMFVWNHFECLMRERIWNVALIGLGHFIGHHLVLMGNALVSKNLIVVPEVRKKTPAQDTGRI